MRETCNSWELSANNELEGYKNPDCKWNKSRTEGGNKRVVLQPIRKTQAYHSVVIGWNLILYIKHLCTRQFSVENSGILLWIDILNENCENVAIEAPGRINFSSRVYTHILNKNFYRLSISHKAFHTQWLFRESVFYHFSMCLMNRWKDSHDRHTLILGGFSWKFFFLLKIQRQCGMDGMSVYLNLFCFVIIIEDLNLYPDTLNQI